ncbi:hypothetical protein [uncultured Bifidobacterium sp.]|uniref:hypothetical protein n=1 Tax=uncultured Bifidobacterium sp. TaxID=165187 RepID=UPI0026157B43|nr:hypothetical protein [uncultured Bifidobacterium sp.]
MAGRKNEMADVSSVHRFDSGVGAEIPIRPPDPHQAESEFTPYQLNLLCQYSYGVGRDDLMTRVGHHDFHDASAGSYWIIRPLHSPRNGFEGMIVAPDKAGHADLGHLVVVYAGTNLKDDALRDIPSALTTFLPPANRFSGQVREADILAREALDAGRKAGFTSGKVVFTGHSMGGGLALIEASRFDLPARVFCAVDPWLVLDGNQRRLLRAHRVDDRFLDFRLRNDLVTGPANTLLTGSPDRSARIIWCGRGPGRIGHWLGDFSFNGQGNPCIADTGPDTHLAILQQRHHHPHLGPVVSFGTQQVRTE